MSDYNFNVASRQSAKGILVIFGLRSYKTGKGLLFLLVTYLISYFQNGTFFGLPLYKIILIITALVLFMIVRSVLEYLNFKFHISNQDFILSKGIINKEHITISKSKIQNIYIKQNLLQQIINVVQLDIETAGDSDAEVAIKALSKRKALALKKELLVNSKQETKTELLEDNIFYKASVKKLILVGLSQNHIKSFFIILVFIGGLQSTYQTVLDNLKIGDTLKAFISTNANNIGFIGLFFFVSIVLILLLSVIVSIVNTFLLNHDLQVIEHEETVEIKKGLLSKVAINLLSSRIQNIEITTNRIKKYFGLHTLSIKQAMVDKKLKKHFNIIGLSKIQVHYLIERLFKKPLDYTTNNKPEFYYKRILILRLLIPIVLLNILSSLVSQHYFWLINVVIFPVVFYYIHWTYTKAYFYFNDDLLVVGSGAIETITQIMEIHKIQAVSLKQSIFQKIRKIATVQVFTASKATTILYVKEESANAIANYLLYQVESKRRDWM